MGVIKLGTLCRTVVWPCMPPVLMYHYIRCVDEDKYTTEILYAKSGSKEYKAFNDMSRIGNSGHWRIQQDLETIRATANDSLPDAGIGNDRRIPLTTMDENPKSLGD